VFAFVVTIIKMDWKKAAQQNIRKTMCWRTHMRERVTIVGTFFIGLSLSIMLLVASIEISDYSRKREKEHNFDCQSGKEEEKSSNLLWSLVVLMYSSCLVFFYSCVCILTTWVYRNDAVDTMRIFEKSKSIYEQRRRSSMININPPFNAIEDGVKLGEEKKEEIEKKCSSQLLLCVYTSKQAYDAWFSYEVCS
jgi:hypothetical protein